jgi:hypothetical protein
MIEKNINNYFIEEWKKSYGFLERLYTIRKEVEEE